MNYIPKAQQAILCWLFCPTNTSCAVLLKSVRLRKNKITSFVKEYPVSSVPSEKQESGKIANDRCGAGQEQYTETSICLRWHVTDSQYKHKQTLMVQISQCHSWGSFTWASSCFLIFSVTKSQGPSFLEEPHCKYYIHYFEANILEIYRTGRTIQFLCKNWKKGLEGKTAYISGWASTPCIWYLFMSPMHCMVYCWYKDDNFTDFIVKHTATKSELC